MSIYGNKELGRKIYTEALMNEGELNGIKTIKEAQGQVESITVYTTETENYVSAIALENYCNAAGIEDIDEAVNNIIEENSPIYNVVVCHDECSDEFYEKVKESCVCIDEAMLFISPEGKKIKKSLKDACKEFKSKEGMIQKLKNNFKYEYDAATVKKMDTVIKKTFDKSITSDIVKQVITDQYGGQTVSYFTHTVGIKGDKVYSFDVYFKPNGCNVSYFNEIKPEKLIIPMDVIKHALDFKGEGGYLIIGKNRISTGIDSGKFVKNQESTSTKLKEYIHQYCNKNLPDDIECVNGKLSDLKFKKKK